MNDVTVKSIADIKAYDGPGSLEGIRFRGVRRELGVLAWGMNILELDPHCTTYPEHDHSKDGQEEVYVIMEGSVVMKVGDDETTLSEGDLVRVGPNVKRTFITHDQGVTFLAIGGTPGKAYEPGPGV